MATGTTNSVVLSTGANIEYILTKPSESIASSESLPTLVFLHFWGGLSRTFKSTIAYLSPKYSTLSVSFRGWGSSTILDSNHSNDAAKYSIATLASDIEELLSTFNFSAYVLIGHSMGGKVAQVVAGSRPEGLKAVALIAPASATPYVMSTEMKEQQLAAYRSPEAAEFVVKNVLTNPRANGERILTKTSVEELVEDMIKGGDGAKEAWPKYGMLEDVSATAGNIEVPVLVIGGSEDVVEPVQRLETVVLPSLGQGHKDVKIVVIPRSGHLIPVEAPKELAAAIDRFANEYKSE